MFRSTFSALLLIGGLFVALSSESSAQENPYAENYFRMLTDRGISTDAAGLRGFLSSHIPGPEDTNRFQQHLADLAHDDYSKREGAMQALLARPPRSLDEIEKLATGTDPEVRWRAKLILDSLRQPGNDLLYASLIVINSRKVQGLADVVLGVAPLCTSDSMQLAMSRALVATATEGDASVLRQNLKSEDVRVRMACLNALVGTLGEAAAADVLPLLADKSDMVRFDAATQLLKFKRAESLKTLGQLLLSEQLTVRNRSIHVLRSTLKVSLPYSGYEPPEDRARHAAEWQKTIEANLEEKPQPAPAATSTTTGSFTPHLVLQSPRHRGLILIGRDGSIQTKEIERAGGRTTALDTGNLLTVHPSNTQVTETDFAGKTIWQSKSLDERPILAARRKDGATLVATMEGSLIEINASGDMIRKTDIGVVVDFEPLPNGDILLISFDGNKVKQVDSIGRLQWQKELPGPPTSVCLAKDGHALVTLQGAKQIVDIDLASKEMKALTAPFRSPTQIEQLEDGRLAIVDVAGAHLADRQGSLIETIKPFPNPAGGF
jgi:hypothetical protein